MAVLGAFIFAAQMINFTIPATGSSGHLGGGLILAVILGPYAGFLTIASVLVVQALFFADGGLLALGCNILNMGFFPCFIAYPLIYKKIAGDQEKKEMVVAGAMIGAIVALQLGALAVVAETYFSGISELPFQTFALLMQPIHLAIGIVEGAASAAVILFVLKARPDILKGEVSRTRAAGILSYKALASVFLAAALLTGAGLSILASGYPDGLEWSIERVAGQPDVAEPASQLHRSLENIQSKTALFPDYSLAGSISAGETAHEEGGAEGATSSWGTSLSGLVGGLLTLFLAGAIWLLVKRRSASA
jgi:cobalt/nickel transport system permease protein